MRIQLLLANQEVELNKDVQIPLNISFQNLRNPSDIIVDYSKTISIPMTVINNRILGNAYRLDRSIVADGIENIGLYLDPTKKIPFQLLYNGQSLMEGYAKFTSSNFSEKNKVYNLNLFGSLGGYFQKMKDVVTSYDRLTDDQKTYGYDYVLDDHLNHPTLDSDYVYKSWMNVDNNVNDFSDKTITPQDIIGFAPSYRGYYGLDFKPNTIQVNDAEIMNLADLLEAEWKQNYCLEKYDKIYQDCTDDEKAKADSYVEKLRASEVLGDGLKDYQMGEYRSYHQRPYIYINKLMYMFQEKSKALTGYDLILDEKWFNDKNPYWTKLVYTFNFIEDINELPSAQNMPQVLSNYTLYENPTDNLYAEVTNSFTLKPNSTYVDLNFGSLMSDFTMDNTSTRFAPYGVWISDNSTIVYEVRLKSDDVTKTIYYWSDPTGKGYKPNLSYLNSDNKILSFAYWDTNISNGVYQPTLKFGVWGSIPSMKYDIPFGYEESDLEISITTKIYSVGSPFKINTGQYGSSQVPVWNYFSKLCGVCDWFGGSYKTTTSNSVNVGLDILYLEEKPIFDIILQYTKMHNLLWKLDEVDKTVTICRRSTFFDHITAEKWDHKLDRSKDYIIEPITFDTKYVNFNYEDIDGYKYKAYKEKYGIPYGMLKLNTSYDFDTNDYDLFSDINPSIVSNRAFVKYSTLSDWDLNSIIQQSYDVVDRMEAASSDDSQGLNVSSWYFRNGNVSLTEGVYITDDSELMIQNKEFCYYTRAWLEEDLAAGEPHVKKIYEIPQFGVTTADGYGCLFNCPKEDYTLTKAITSAKGKYIYDNFWNDYIDERYSIQNKKLTAYFNISPHDYLNFDFNRFVIVGGQLFMVNKIFDYDLNSSATTKCELIQVSDVSIYTNDKIVFDGKPSTPIEPVDPDNPDNPDNPDTPTTPDVYTFEHYSLEEGMSHEGGQGTVWFRSLLNDTPYPISKDNATITGIYGATIDGVRDDSLEHGDGVYGITYTIPANNTDSVRYATITINHPITLEKLVFEIDQAYYKPDSTKKVNVVATPIYNPTLRTISYELHFDATNLSGGTLNNVAIQVSDSAGGNGSQYGYRSLGTIDVPRGSRSETYIGLFKNIDLVNPWFLVYYDRELKFASNCMQEQPEPYNTTI